MKKNIKILSLFGLVATSLAGCETPGGAMFMSALGAASMAKGGTPNQMAMASAYKNIGDASLAYQNNKRLSEAIQNSANQGGINQPTEMVIKYQDNRAIPLGNPEIQYEVPRDMYLAPFLRVKHR